MKQLVTFWVEGYFYHPTTAQKLLSLFVYPIAFLYCFIVWVRYVFSTPRNFGIPIVSVGNLTVGGSGKTPLVSALCHLYKKPAIILRGYGRASKGLVVVKNNTTILCDVSQSGDEAMLYAQSLPHAVVIVSEKRDLAIRMANSMGCEVVFLDDGYGKHSIQKLDLVISVETPNSFCLPSGPYRERLWKGKKVVMLDENRSFFRQVRVENPTNKMVLVTAIARPQRLDPYLPSVMDKIYFEDHHFYTKEELLGILTQTGADSLLVTQKDFVKMAAFNLPISLLTLDLELNPQLIETVREYVDAKKD